MAAYQTSDVSIATFSEFDYFRPSLIQTEKDREYWKVVPASNFTSDCQTLEFDLPGETNTYRDLNNSFLEIRCKIVNADGTATAQDDPVSPANNFLHALFSTCEVSVCGVTISENEKRYPYRAFIETLLSTTSEVIKLRISSTGWVLDEDLNTADSVVLADAQNERHNPALLKRREPFTRSREVTLIGRPHADLFHQNINIPPECRITIKFTRGNDKLAIMAPENANYKVVLTRARMFVCSVVGDPAMILAHREMLKTTNFRIPINHVSIQAVRIPKDISEHNITNLFQKKLPKRIVIGFVRQSRIDGTFNRNPFVFENFNLETLAVKLSGQTVFGEVQKLDFENNDYLIEYFQTLVALGLDNSNRGIKLTPQLWSKLYNLHAFKLVPGPVDNYIEHPQSGPVDISIKFRQPLPEAVDVLIYSETNKLLEIDSLQAATYA